MQLTLEQLREIAELAGKRGAEQALQEAGITTEEGIADRLFIKKLRQTSEKMVLKFFLTLTAAAVTGVIYAMFGR